MYAGGKRQPVEIAMRKLTAVLSLSLLFADAALAAQGPGAGPGTAGPLAQWAAFAVFIALSSLGVIFSAWDDGTGFES